MLLVASAIAGCSRDGDAAPIDSTIAEPAPGLFSALGDDVDDVRFPSLFAMAEASDLATEGWLVDVEDGYTIDGVDGTRRRMIELIVDRATIDEPIRLLWEYPPGFELDEIMEALPVGSRMVVYADRFDVPAAERSRWHHAAVDGEDPDDVVGDPDGGHRHWIPVTARGVFVEDPETALVDRYDDITYLDEPDPDAPLEDWLVLLLPFDDVTLRGTCTDVTFDVPTDEPTEFGTPEDAAADFVAHEQVLDGLEAVDGKLLLRHEAVGSYDIVERPDDTFAVVAAQWCHPTR